MPVEGNSGGSGFSLRGVGDFFKGIGDALTGKHRSTCNGEECPPGVDFLHPAPQTDEQKAAARAKRNMGRTNIGTSEPSGSYEPYRGSPKSKKRKVRKGFRSGGICDKVNDYQAELARQGIWPYAVCLADGTARAASMIGNAVYDALLTTPGSKMKAKAPVAPRPAPGTRSAQRGFVAIPEPTTTDLPPVRTVETPPRGPTTVTQPTRRVLVKPALQPMGPGYWDDPYLPEPSIEEYIPKDVPVDQPLRPGEIEDYGELDEVVVTARRVGTADTAYPGSRPTAPAPSPARVPGPAGPSAPGTGKTRGRTRLALPRLGSVELLVGALLTDAIGKPGRRLADVGKAPSMPGTGALIPRQNLGIPPLEPSFAYVGSRSSTRSKSDSCSCDEKKKERKPRKRRSQCWKGSYTETATGLRKVRREQVPC